MGLGGKKLQEKDRIAVLFSKQEADKNRKKTTNRKQFAAQVRRARAMRASNNAMDNSTVKATSLRKESE